MPSTLQSKVDRHVAPHIPHLPPEAGEGWMRLFFVALVVGLLISVLGFGVDLITAIIGWIAIGVVALPLAVLVRGLRVRRQAASLAQVRADQLALHRQAKAKAKAKGMGA